MINEYLRLLDETSMLVWLDMHHDNQVRIHFCWVSICSDTFKNGLEVL